MQLYTVHGVKNGRNVIGMYALLTNKQQHTYERMLRHVEILTGNANPTSISVDFERAVINACSTGYPLSELSGCFFHLSQNVYKRVQETHLTDLYQNNVVFRTNIRMICALAFVPLQDVVHSFEMLCRHRGANGHEQVILDYFERTYIGVLQARVRRPPMFPHALWYTHNRVLNRLPRTTNVVEGWHHVFKTSVGQCHANIIILYGG